VPNVAVSIGDGSVEHSNHQGSETVIVGSEGLENNELKRTRSARVAMARPSPLNSVLGGR
jgi:hypothetical protein